MNDFIYPQVDKAYYYANMPSIFPSPTFTPQQPDSNRAEVVCHDQNLRSGIAKTLKPQVSAKTRVHHRELRALLFTMSVSVRAYGLSSLSGKTTKSDHLKK